MEREDNSFCFHPIQQYISLFYLDDDMFRSLEQSSGYLYKTHCMLPYSRFCKDGLMMANWPKHVVIKIK
jgi:hypothetical protein